MSTLVLPKSEPDWYSSNRDRIGSLLKSKPDWEYPQIKKHCQHRVAPQHWSTLELPKSEPDWYSSSQDEIGNLLKSAPDWQSPQIKTRLVLLKSRPDRYSSNQDQIGILQIETRLSPDTTSNEQNSYKRCGFEHEENSKALSIILRIHMRSFTTPP